MVTASAGILVYHYDGDGIAVLLVHPGWSYRSKRDTGAWFLPKGGIDDGEGTESTARREFEEEDGVPVHGRLQPLGRVRQRAGKVVYGYALEGDLDVRTIRSNEVTIAWPPRSSRTITFPKLIVLHGLHFRWPGRRFSQANVCFSIAFEDTRKTISQSNSLKVTT